MANKEAVFTLKVNTGNSIQNIQKLEKSTAALDQEMKEVQMTAAQDLGGAIKMLEQKMESLAVAGKRNTDEYKRYAAELGKLSQVQNNLTMDTNLMARSMDDVGGSISVLEDRLYTLAATGQKNTQEFKDLFNELTRLKSVQREVDALVDQSAISMDDTSAAVGLLEDRMYRLAVQGKQNTKEYRDLVAQIAKYKTTLLDADMAVETQMISTNDLSGSIGKLEDKLYALQAQGKMNSKEFRQTTEQLVQYKKQLQSVDLQVDAMMQGGRNLNTALSIGNTAMAGMQGFENAMKLAGVESEALTKAMQKMQLMVGVLTAVQQVSVALQKEGLIMTTLSNAADSIRNFVLTGQFAATEALVVANEELAVAEGEELAMTEAGTAADGTAIAAEGGLVASKEANVAVTGEKVAVGVTDTTVTEGQTAATGGLTVAQNAQTTATVGTTMATKALRIALIATGIGALIVGIGLLVTYWGKVTSAIQSAYDWFNKTGPVVKILAGALLFLTGPIGWVVAGIYALTKALEWLGIVDDEQTRKMKANAEKKTKQTEKEVKAAVNASKRKQAAEEARLDFEIRKAQAAGKDTEKLEKQRLMVTIKRTDEQIKQSRRMIEQLKEEMKLLKATGDADSKRYKDLKKSLNEYNDQLRETKKINRGAREDLTIQAIEQKKAAEEAAKERAEAAKQAAAEAAQRRKDRLQAAKDERAAIIAAEKQMQQELLALQREYEDNLLSLKAEGKDKELETAQQAFDRYKQDFLAKAMADELAANEKMYVEGTISREQYEKAKAEINATAVDKLTDAERLVYTSKEEMLRQQLAGITKKWDDQAKAERDALQEEYIKSTSDKYQLELMEFEKSQKAELDKRKKYLDAGLITQAEYDTFIQQQELALSAKTIEINNAKAEALKELEKQIKQDRLDNIQGLLDTVTEQIGQLKTFNDAINEYQNAQLENQKAADDARIAQLEEKKNKELANANLTADQKKKIEDRFAAENYKIQLAAYEREEKIKKSQFQRDKAFKMSEVLVNTASAIVKGIAQFGPPPSPAGIAAIASAALIGATQLAAIAAQKYNAGAAPTMSASGGAGAAGASTGASASQFTVSQNTQGTNLNDLLSGEGPNKQPITKVVVLESDITDTQHKVEMQQKLSTY